MTQASSPIHKSSFLHPECTVELSPVPDHLLLCILRHQFRVSITSRGSLFNSIISDLKLTEIEVDTYSTSYQSAHLSTFCSLLPRQWLPQAGNITPSCNTLYHWKAQHEATPQIQSHNSIVSNFLPKFMLFSLKYHHHFLSTTCSWTS